MPTSTRSASARLALLGMLAIAGCGGGGGGAGTRAGTETGAGAERDTGTAISPAQQSITVKDVGLENPESVVYDYEADLYLVSNVNGAPLGVDDNGFIAQVKPDGTMLNLRWIDGQAERYLVLNSPKGMVLKGDTLFVADIDTVRAFQRKTGEPLGSRAVPGASSLNGMAMGPDGTVYVSDTGLNPNFSSSRTDAIWAFTPDGPRKVVGGMELASPNGITVNGDTLYYVTYAAAQVGRVVLGGPGAAQAVSGPELVATLPAGQLDGIVRLDDGSFLVSSWEVGAIFRLPPGSTLSEPVMNHLDSPAGIGWDPGRRRVLIPLFNENQLVIRTLPR